MSLTLRYLTTSTSCIPGMLVPYRGTRDVGTVVYSVERTDSQTQQETERWLSNVNYAEGWSSISVTQLDTLTDYMQRIREITVEGNAGIWENKTREDLANDIN